MFLPRRFRGPVALGWRSVSLVLSLLLRKSPPPDHGRPWAVAGGLRIAISVVGGGRRGDFQNLSCRAAETGFLGLSGGAPSSRPLPEPQCAQV